MRKVIEAVTPKGRRYGMLRLGVGVHYAEKDGRAVLRHETHWTRICGIWINTKWGCVWLRFRRFYE
jgi:hypothetical protein